ncbi:unnamed protein product, partial [Prorocentrum cordatum]
AVPAQLELGPAGARAPGSARCCSAGAMQAVTPVTPCEVGESADGHETVSVTVPDSDADDAAAPLASEPRQAPSVVFRCRSAVGRRSCRGWSLGLLAAGLAGAAALLRLGAAPRGAGGAARDERLRDTAEALSLYVNLSAVDLGAPGKPSEYLLLRGPANQPNSVAIQ